MALQRRSGRQNKLTGQVGEYRVAAELARRGLIATTFTGNVPHYDVIASDALGRHVSVQVKTSNSPSWQFAIDKFCKITLRGNRQIVGPALALPVRRLVVVLVRLGQSGKNDQFFICTWLKLRNMLVDHHRTYLRDHGGRRPKSPTSLHTAIGLEHLARFEDRWSTVEHNLR